MHKILFIISLWCAPMAFAMGPQEPNLPEQERVLTLEENMSNLYGHYEHHEGDDWFNWYHYEQRKKIIKNIIEKNKGDVNAIVYKDITPLAESITQRDIDFTLYLLRHGANPNKKCARNLQPLHQPIHSFNYHNSQSKTYTCSLSVEECHNAYHWHHNCIEMIRMLIFFNADPFLKINKASSPFSYGCQQAQELIIQVLQEKTNETYKALSAHMLPHLAYIALNYIEPSYKVPRTSVKRKREQ